MVKTPYSDEINAIARENLNKEDAKLLIDNFIKCMEDIQKFIIDCEVKYEIPYHWIVGILSITANDLFLKARIDQIMYLTNFIKEQKDVDKNAKQ